jgi:hypothetical protein
MISAALLHAPILAALPAGCREAQVKKEKARFVISFKCCVSCDDNKGKPRKYVYVRHANTSANGWPKLCHDAVMRKHGACFDVDCPLAGKTVTEGKLEKQVNSLKADLKRKSFELDSSKVSTHPNPIPHPGFGKATPTQTLTLILIQGSEKQTASGQSRAKKTATERGKRRATKIEPSNREEWKNTSSSSDALQNAEMGLVATLQYWCNGSSLKCEQLVLSAVRHLNME